jgi:hypothetical protein
MRKVVVYELLSLDGVAEACENFVTEWDDTLDANLGDVIAPQDAVILGRRSYDEWSRFWSTSEIEPFASFINGVPKYIATSTPLDGNWPNAQAIEGDLVPFTMALKQTAAATLECTRVSASRGHCSPRALSTNFGSLLPRRFTASAVAYSTDFRRSRSNFQAARYRPQAT